MPPHQHPFARTDPSRWARWWWTTDRWLLGATAALILEVIPPFEADDEIVLEDLSASVTYWRDALEAQKPKRSTPV